MSHRLIVTCFLILTVLGMSGTTARAQNDVDEHRACAVCGMDRKAYGYSRMLVRYGDGSRTGVCSLHCAVVDMDAHKDRQVAALLVADRTTRALVDADKAIWVVGGKKRGVMTQRPKWAFATEDAARSFVKEYGGAITPWVTVLAAAREEALTR